MGGGDWDTADVGDVVRERNGIGGGRLRPGLEGKLGLPGSGGGAEPLSSSSFFLLEGNGGSLEGSYSGAFTLDEAALKLVRFEMADTEERPEATDAMDSIELFRIELGADGLRGGRLGAASILGDGLRAGRAGRFSEVDLLPLTEGGRGGGRRLPLVEFSVGSPIAWTTLPSPAGVFPTSLCIAPVALSLLVPLGRFGSAGGGFFLGRPFPMTWS
jgi:hypothetical protein